uniref:Uncharacterized protein n=1 Tax=Anguilla anguilla TaxID=7936 RepID=A0A0E9UEZ4_ANGAN
MHSMAQKEKYNPSLSISRVRLDVSRVKILKCIFQMQAILVMPCLTSEHS